MNSIGSHYGYPPGRIAGDAIEDLASIWASVDASHSHTYNVHMIKFDWNPAKARSNLKKHGVSFEEARSVFYDEYAVQFDDEENSQEDERFLMLGLSSELRVLIVCHCERESGEVIRIISARKATKKERDYYRGGAV